jgi:hypothetical protein
MSEPPISPAKVLINTVALMGVLLTMAGLIWIMYYYTRPEPPDRARWAERQKAREDVQAASQEVLDHYALTDPARGVVRLSLDRAMELTLAEWQNPAGGRAALLARAQKAAPVIPAVPAATNAPASTNPPAAAPKPAAAAQ